VSAATPTPNEARVAIRNGPLVGAVLSRVVGMLAARALCPIDRLDDALLVTDAIAAHAPSHTEDGRVVVTVRADVGGIELRVAPLRPEGAAALLADATLPGVGNVLERVADEITSGPSADGSSEELHIRIAFAGGDAP
jgi:hypothetical protein